MSAVIVMGGQFGSEGKGKISAYLAHECRLAVRSGGPNAGHTIHDGGVVQKLQMLPCALVNPNCELCISAGGVVHVETLLREIRIHQVSPSRFTLDPQAVIIQETHPAYEVAITQSIGSTGKGVGAAIESKIRRDGSALLAGAVPELKPFLGDVADKVNAVVDRGEQVMLEGTQGFGLSLNHGHYPYVTGRDTTAASLCADAGISPRAVRDIVLVVRTYPIRVGGNSGPLKDEISWEDVTARARSLAPIIEHTTVTGRVRRVGLFDLAAVRRAVTLNRPTQIALTFADYIDHANRGVMIFEQLTPEARSFVEKIEQATGVPVTLIGTGPSSGEIVDRRAAYRARTRI